MKMGWYLAGLTAVVLSGCATKIAGLKHSPSFTYAAVTSGKLAIGGVASATDKLEEGKGSSLGGLLRTALLDERKDYSISPVGSVMNKLGSQYPQVLAEIQTTGTLSEKSLKALQSKISDSRFITFARIENDDVQNDRHETSNTDRDGKTVEGSEKVISSAQRSITASLQIYDLKTGEVAWGGTVTKSLSNTRQYDKEKEIGLVSVIKAIKGDSQNQSVDQKYPYPSAPESSKVLARVFAGFGENLPEKD